MQKLTKEQMLSELMIKLETIDGKLDKLLGIMDISTSTGEQLDILSRLPCRTLIDSEEFDGAYK